MKVLNDSLEHWLYWLGSMRRAAFLPLCVALLWSVGSNGLAAPTIEDYGRLPTVSMVAISPSGETVAFRMQKKGMDLIAVQSLVSGETERVIDTASIVPDEVYFFDEHRLIVVGYTHRRPIGVREGFDLGTAYLLDVRTGDIDQMLTPGDVIYRTQTGLGSVVGVSKNGELAYMPAYVPRSEDDRAPNYSLLSVNLETLRRPQVIHRGSHNTISYFVDKEGNTLAEEVFDNRRNRHTIYSYVEGESEDEGRVIYQNDTDIRTVTPVGLTTDREALMILGATKDSGRRAHYTLSLREGTVSEAIMGREDADTAGVIMDIDQIVYGVWYGGLRASYRFFDEEVNARMSEILDLFSRNYVTLVSWSPTFEHLVVRVEGWDSAGDYFLFSKGKSARLILHSRPGIRPEHVHPVVEFSYKARDGLIIPALLTVPRDNAESIKHLPAVMLPHGGPAAHDTIGFHWMAQALANRGYLVIQPQFRGSSGFGVEHEIAGHGQWGKKMQDDLTDAIRFLINEDVVDPERICIMGASYGGYAALAGGAFTPELYRCVVSINGVSDLSRMLDSDRMAHGSDHWVVAYLERTMVDDEANRANLNRVSPAHFAQDFTAPVLLIHGRNDSVVPADQSRRMQRRLRREGKPVTLVQLNGEDHYLSRSETRLRALEESLEFIDRHIGTAETQ